MNFSIDTLVSMLKTNFLYPNSSAFATPNPKVTSDDCFFPSFTTTSLSPSRSNANPISYPEEFEIKSSRFSDVGSGPLDDSSKFSLMTLTSHPNFFRNVGAIVFAAPPPISITTFGGFFISPTIFCAASL